MQTPDFTIDSPPILPLCREVSVLSLERRASPETGGGELFTLRLRSPGWDAWLPGQFVMIRPHRVSRPDILWARPFSISHADTEELRIVFQVAGRGTADMLELERGETVTVWGPLGNGFAVSRSGPTLLLAGGIGIAPFVGYIEHHPAPETLRLEFGHKHHIDCYPFMECRDAHCSLSEELFPAASHRETCPEDLTRFVAVMDEAIRDVAGRGGLVLACGPMPFLKAVRQFALHHNARAQLSLETRMACGVGACLGCVVKSTAAKSRQAVPVPDGFAYVQTCTNGPVFWADQIDLTE
ncbi:Dihydroorotate dehydrogenase, electron transfer subunit [uncultured delta proteobacterium]|uniref:Dihydroorotate dehydrogenase, electron transfer subunit n=1 Tax=uncultured delta proteobacterium TaxID=34034 RepID=A0A212JDY4_9DELT|nr:Dihydroorotate dehydrogenase, electron transfer subunit [uncultured delta proteobacterium]